MVVERDLKEETKETFVCGKLNGLTKLGGRMRKNGCMGGKMY